jgi:ABC-type transporter Mla MlaB component
MSAHGPRTLHFAVRGPISREDLPGLCGRVCALLSARNLELAVCDVRGVEPDAVTVDALARLQLATTRRGCTIQLRNASDGLVELVRFMGLEDVLPGR